MTQDQSDVIKMVYRRFIDHEVVEWGSFDDNLEMYGWLSQAELIKESKIKFLKHSKGNFRCSQDHSKEHCFAPYILESVDIILSLYGKTKSLHEKNAYILTYYLVMSEMGLIYSDSESSAV